MARLILRMPEENKDTAPNSESAISEPVPQIILDKTKNEITVTDPSGNTIAFKAKIIEEEPEEDDEIPPLEPEEFEQAIRLMDVMGLGWTAGRTPSVKPKNADAEGALVSPEFERLQNTYPHLPFEVFMATSHFLTGSNSFAAIAGGKEKLQQKGQIAGEFIVDHEFRTEFFFRSAIKVPYLKDIDWEVVSKLYERGVTGSPGIAYGLLALSLEDAFLSNRQNPRRHTTVAVDEKTVDHLIKILTEVKTHLAIARQQIDIQSKPVSGEEK
jgi:hypothetical protein